jgi:hypothetical protein
MNFLGVMYLFTRTSSYYLKVLSPYVSLEEKEVVFRTFAISKIDDIHWVDRRQGVPPSSLYSYKLFREPSNKRLPFNGFASESFQSSTCFAHPHTFSLKKVSTKAKLIFEMENRIGRTNAIKENKENLDFTWKRKEIPRIAFSFKTRQRCYKHVRPLLSINRFDIQNLCLLWGLPIYPDRSNKQFIQSRNRIRKQLLPLVRFYFNPQIEAVLFQFTEILNEEHSYLERLAYFLVDEDLFPSSSLPYLCKTQDDLCTTTTIDFILQKKEYRDLKKLKRSNAFSLLSLPRILRRRILKSYLESLTGKSANFFYIERLLFLLKELVN